MLLTTYFHEFQHLRIKITTYFYEFQHLPTKTATCALPPLSPPLPPPLPQPTQLSQLRSAVQQLVGCGRQRLLGCARQGSSALAIHKGLHDAIGNTMQ